jgi:hypothetical protein
VLEGNTRHDPPQLLNMTAIERSDRLKEDLRLRLIKREVQRQDERNREHQKCCAKPIGKLEACIADAERAIEGEQERHRQTMDELEAARTAAKDQLGELMRPLAADETSEQRLEAVMGS